MTNQATTVTGRVYTPIATGAVFGNSTDDDVNNFPDQPNVLSLYPFAHDPDFMVREALKRDLSQVDRLRFDPVNVCNLRCVFCFQDLERPHAAITPETLRTVLEAIAPTCKRIIFGCAFEPTMAKNFAEYGRVIAEVVDTKFKHRPVANIITNGTLIGRHDLTPFLSFLSWIHISCHSHIKEKFEALEPRGKFETVRDNILKIRSTYPDLRVHIEHVVNNVNVNDVVDFIRWGFGEMDVNSINLRRVDGEMPKQDKSPLARHILGENTNFAVDATQWQALAELVNRTFPAKAAHITTAPGRVTDVIELTKADLQNFGN